jgi:uncharacterized protein YdgA (DUF945 family)
MSAYIHIHGWSGENREDVTARLAKVFRMPKDRATAVVRDVAGGKTWQFDQAVPDAQAKHALAYLLALGFSAELAPADMPAPMPVFSRRPPLENLEAPPVAAQKKSFLSFLSFGNKAEKKVVLDGWSGSAKASGVNKTKSAGGGAKIAVAGLVVLAGLIGAAPYWFGMTTENAFKEALDQLKTRGFAVQMVGYNRGWLGAEATFILRTTRSSPAQIWNVTSRITHGPLDVGVLLEGNLPASTFQALIDSRAKITLSLAGVSLTQLPELRILETVPFSGDWTAKVQASGHQTVTQDQDKIKWMGGEGQFSHPADLSRLQGEFLGKPLTLEFKKGKMQVSNIKFNVDLQPGPAGMTIGRGALTFDNIKIEDGAGIVNLQKISLTTSVDAKGNDLNSAFGLVVGEIKVGEDVFGPGELRLEAHKLDAVLLKQLEEVNAKSGDPKDTKGAAERGSKITAILAEIAKKAPEFGIPKIAFKTKEGDLTGKVKVVVDGSQVDLAKNPLLALTVLDVDANLMFSEGFARQIVKPIVQGAASFSQGKKPGSAFPPQFKTDSKEVGEFLSNMVIKGFLTKEGDAYLITLAYKQGHLTLNGKPGDQFLTLR